MQHTDDPCPHCGHAIVVGFFSPDHCNNCGWVEPTDEAYLLMEEVDDLLSQEQECRHARTDYDENGVLCCLDCGHQFGIF